MANQITRSVTFSVYGDMNSKSNVMLGTFTNQSVYSTTFNKDIRLDDTIYRCSFYDFIGSDIMPSLNSDIVLICFSTNLEQPSSFDRIDQVYKHDIHKNHIKVPIFLIGTHKNTRSSINYVNFALGKSKADELYAIDYLEVDEEDQGDVEQVISSILTQTFKKTKTTGRSRSKSEAPKLEPAPVIENKEKKDKKEKRVSQKKNPDRESVSFFGGFKLFGKSTPTKLPAIDTVESKPTLNRVNSSRRNTIADVHSPPIILPPNPSLVTQPPQSISNLPTSKLPVLTPNSTQNKLNPIGMKVESKNTKDALDLAASQSSLSWTLNEPTKTTSVQNVPPGTSSVSIGDAKDSDKDPLDEDAAIIAEYHSSLPVCNYSSGCKRIDKHFHQFRHPDMPSAPLEQIIIRQSRALDWRSRNDNQVANELERLKRLVVTMNETLKEQKLAEERDLKLLKEIVGIKDGTKQETFNKLREVVNENKRLVEQNLELQQILEDQAEVIENPSLDSSVNSNLVI